MTRRRPVFPVGKDNGEKRVFIYLLKFFSHRTTPTPEQQHHDSLATGIWFFFELVRSFKVRWNENSGCCFYIIATWRKSQKGSFLFFGKSGIVLRVYRKAKVKAGRDVGSKIWCPNKEMVIFKTFLSINLPSYPSHLDFSDCSLTLSLRHNTSFRNSILLRLDKSYSVHIGNGFFFTSHNFSPLSPADLRLLMLWQLFSAFWS